MELTVKSAGPDMLPDIMRIERESFSDPWSLGSFASALNNPACKSYACFCDGAFAGYIMAFVISPEAEIINLAVDKNMRRNGIASCLINKLFEEALKEKCDTFFLEVRKSNTPARELYAKHGFEELGTRKRYYRNPVEDAIVMIKKAW